MIKSFMGGIVRSAVPIPGTTTITYNGLPAISLAGGSLTARTIANTDYYTFTPRIGLVSSGSQMTYRIASNFLWGSLGFRVSYRFALSDLLLNNNFFIGMSLSNAAMASANPATLTNVIGLGHGPNETWRVYSAGTTAQTPTNVMSLAMAKGSVYDFTITVLPLRGDPRVDEDVIYWSLKDNHGSISDYAERGALTSTDPAVRLQRSSILTPLNGYRSGTGASVDLMGITVETTY